MLFCYRLQSTNGSHIPLQINLTLHMLLQVIIWLANSMKPPKYQAFIYS